ncbi:MAG: hypothetical protein MI919_18755, partial [Holophagales bacterium]|nr:hypothetical protein [Holophagales bacterium]
MRHRYFYLDPALVQALLEGMGLQRLFNQMLLASGGDVEQARDWMRQLQQRGYLPEDLDLDAFFEELERQQVITTDGEGNLQLTSVGERRIRRSAFEEIFSSMKKGGHGYHPVRSSGEGSERLP